MLERLREDVATIFRKDPAARNLWEVVTYAGLWAVVSHRAAHGLWLGGHTTGARWISQVSRLLTGIEIHPGATIGRRFFIDHGMGVVIGETAVVGDDVLMYHGVTLGGTSLEKTKRHPTIGNGVLIGMGAKIIGNINIGDNARIGANAVVTRDVPPDSTAVGIPARVVKRGGVYVPQMAPPVMDSALNSVDPDAETIRRLMNEIEALHRRLLAVESHAPASDSLPAPRSDGWEPHDIDAVT